MWTDIYNLYYRNYPIDIQYPMFPIQLIAYRKRNKGISLEIEYMYIPDEV